MGILKNNIFEKRNRYKYIYINKGNAMKHVTADSQTAIKGNTPKKKNPACTIGRALRDDETVNGNISPYSIKEKKNNKPNRKDK